MARTPIKNSKNSQSEETRAALILAGARLFATHGFHGVSVRKLTKEAGVNLATISYHFGGKAGLYEALILEMIDRRDEIFPSQKEVRERIEQCQQTPDSRGQLVDWFTAKVTSGLLGNKDNIWATLLITREMTHPTDVLPKLQKHFFEPTQQTLKIIAEALLPEGTSREEIIISAQASLNMILKFIEGQKLICQWIGWEKYTDENIRIMIQILSKRTRGMYGLPME